MPVGTQNGGESRHGSDWRDVQREAQDAARDIADEAQERGSEFGYQARDRAAEYVERRKDSAAQSVEDIATTLRETGGTLEDRPNVRMFVDSAADGLEMLADEIRERSLVEMVSDMEEFARRRPATFAAAAGVAGFVLARFLKSSGGDADERRAYSDQMRYERAERRRSRGTGEGAERRASAASSGAASGGTTSGAAASSATASPSTGPGESKPSETTGAADATTKATSAAGSTPGAR